MKKLILKFLKTYCVKVRVNDTLAYVELMMDNHKCIEFNGTEWYVPEDSSFWTEDDHLIHEFILSKYYI